MYNYNGRQVTKADYKRLVQVEKEIRLFLENRIPEKYDYSQWPHVILKSTAKPHIPMINGTLFPDE